MSFWRYMTKKKPSLSWKHSEKRLEQTSLPQLIKEEYARKKSALIRRAQVARRSNESSLRTKLNTGKPYRDWWKSFLLGERPLSLGERSQPLKILDVFS